MRIKEENSRTCQPNSFFLPVSLPFYKLILLQVAILFYGWFFINWIYLHIVQQIVNIITNNKIERIELQGTK